MPLSPERQAAMAQARDEQLAQPEPAPLTPEQIEAAAGRAQLRTFLLSGQFPQGAKLLRQICNDPEHLAGTTYTEFGLVALGMRAVWDTAMAYATLDEPEGDEV